PPKQRKGVRSGNVRSKTTKHRRVGANGNGKVDGLVEIPDPVLAETMEFIDRFVVLSEDQLFVLSLWAVHTWAVDVATQTPYMIVTSPEMRCGKSRLLEVLGLLVAKAWQGGVASAAVLFRGVEGSKSTLSLD